MAKSAVTSQIGYWLTNLLFIRAAETIHSLTYHSGKAGAEWIVDKTNGLEHLLVSARQSLSLFQHHDGITGTAKDHVVIDYGKRYYYDK